MLPDSEWLCECVANYLRTLPTVDEILSADAAHTVCTATQCFETHADAYSIYEPPTGAASMLTTGAAATLLAAAALLALVAARPRSREAEDGCAAHNKAPMIAAQPRE